MADPAAPVTVVIDGDLARVRIDSPPVNAASRAVRAGLLEAVERVEGDPAVRGAILMCRGRTFVAGGDVREFDRPPQAPYLTDVVRRIERAEKPWLAAIHGSALGGGLELALGCRWRIAHRRARLGLPEVNLGLIPGAGGTVRLPRIVPLELAVRMVGQGQPIGAGEARENGLVDALSDTDLEADAVAFLGDVLNRPWPPRTLDRPAPALPKGEFWDRQKAATGKRHRGQAAPGLALASLRAGLAQEPETALDAERATHLELRKSPQSRALRHIFFAERAALKPPVDARPAGLDRAGIVGGGTMGAGIAVAFLDAGIPVTLLERDPASRDRGLAAVEKTYDGAVARGRLGAAERKARLGMLTGSIEAGDLGDADIVVEAVFEDLAAKREVFQRLDRCCKPGAVLATNTSYLDPNLIAAATTRPEAVIGLHFFSPAHVMKLLEVVPTDLTSPRTVATAWAVARRLGKTPVLAGVCEGFIGNRILKSYRREAEGLLLAGGNPVKIDQALRTFGMPMGIFEMQDLAGLDIAAAQRAAARARGETVPAPISDRLVAEGRLGRKTGGGWYDYEAGNRSPRPSGRVAEIIAEIAGTDADRTPEADTVPERIFGAMVAEGRRILDEGIASSSAAIDLVEVLGFGFPRWRGGLMYWADHGRGEPTDGA